MQQACDLMNERVRALQDQHGRDRNSSRSDIAGLRHTVYAVQLQNAVAVDRIEALQRRSEKGPLRWLRQLCASGS